MRFAFPSDSSDSGIENACAAPGRRRSLTVAGTAQVERNRALPVSRLTAHANACAGTKRAHTIAHGDAFQHARQGTGAACASLTAGGGGPTLARTLVLACALVRMQLNGKQGARLLWIGSTCAAPATVSEKRCLDEISGAAEPASMSTRKAASAYNHWARNHSRGKVKRRFRQPGYRPEYDG